MILYHKYLIHLNCLCKVITVDARNHGESPHADVMDYHAMSQDVAQLILDLNFDYVDVLGHSMGGKIAMTLALTKVTNNNT